MRIKMLLKVALFAFLFLSCFTIELFASQASEYLCDFGKAFYRTGNYDDALVEFKKVLLIEPRNETAKKYKREILKKQASFTEFSRAEASEAPREEAIDAAFSNLKQKDEFLNGSSREEESYFGNVLVKGETQVSFGATPEDAIWKQANADLNERNSRILSRNAYNNLTNTFDTRIYDRFRVNIDTDNTEGFNFHGNITVDPWSFTGKSEKFTITGAGGDPAEIELKYWSNTRYTLNETIFSLQKGDSFALPEIKVEDSKISTPVRITSVNTNIYTLPEIKIKREFQPVREFWFDYKQEKTSLRFFPIAYQDQALTFDDPLRLSNNHTWWEESPWLDRWLPGNFNSGATPVADFSRGKFDDSLSFLTRDSDGVRLTALRGFSLGLTPYENFSVLSTFASPKGLWQDYERFDNLINATRLNYLLLDNLSLGSIYTYRVGFNEANKRDIANYVWGFDTGYEILEGVKLFLEGAASRTHRDITSPGYETRLKGNAYFFSLMGAFPRVSLMSLKNGYFDIKPDKTEGAFVKYRIYASRMDSGFDPSLSTYRETRDDSFWSRHIHFRKPLQYYYTGLYYPSTKWEDIEPYSIGNGIDIGREVIGFRLESSFFERKLDNIFDVRNVHKADGKFAENVARDELTYEFNDKLTTKLLGIYQRMPKTIAGIDPFIFDSDTGIYLNNTAILQDKDPSLKTGSLGLEYAFADWCSLSGIWERTNDYTLAYDNFPRGNLNSTSFTTFREYDLVFRRQDPFLYSQGLFPLPPYPFYNIFKSGLRFDPFEKLSIYLDYTRNEFKSAGQIDDNINHVGFEASFIPTKKLGFYFRYSFSRWNDINRMLGGFNKIYLSHHNFFSEFRYLPGIDDELVFQYGESGRSPLATITTDPFGGSLQTLDTRHIFRLYYRRKF